MSLLKAFSYWGDPKPREPEHVYDLRRYVLRVSHRIGCAHFAKRCFLQPGQMIEWANNWVKGITYRRDYNQDVGGWFTQVGSLYIVYHLWGECSAIRAKAH